MVNLRRRVLGTESEEESVAPLYQLKVGTASINSSKVMTVSEVNHVNIVGTSSGNSYVVSDDLIKYGVNNGLNNPTWITFPVGVEITLKVKMTEATYSNNFAVRFLLTGGTTESSIITDNFVPSNTSVKEVKFTLDEEEETNRISFYTSATKGTKMEFDLELWIGNVRYL